MPSPLELLTPDENRKPSFLFDKWNPFMTASLGFGCACFINWALHRPIFSGIQQHIAFTAGGGAAGIYFDRKRNDYLAERDAVLRHYIELHPEDFPTPERKTYGELFESWAPIR